MTLLTLLLTPTYAADPVPVQPMDDGNSVKSITWARPFTLPAPESYDIDTVFQEGWLVELTADPALLRPSQVADPVLYAGTHPLMRFNWDWDGGCVVALIPASVDLVSTELYFGSPELPERVDEARAQAELTAARQVGVKPLDPATVTAAISAGGATLAAADLREVHRLAMERVAECTSTPADLMRAGIPESKRR